MLYLRGQTKTLLLLQKIKADIFARLDCITLREE